MGKELESLKIDLKLSFSKAKEHISSLEEQIRSLKEQVKSLQNALEGSNSQIMPELPPLPIPLPEPPKEESSIGNEGVYSFIHSFKQSFIQQTSIQNLLSKITKQELLVLLTIVQLENELGALTYIDLSNKLKLSQGCLRGDVTTLMRKGAPIYKEKHNNKIILIKTSPHFKAMDKQALIDAYYGMDSAQKRLFD